jgi:RNA processing factor Prp31
MLASAYTAQHLLMPNVHCLVTNVVAARLKLAGCLLQLSI